MKILSVLPMLFLPFCLIAEEQGSILEVIRERVENSRYRHGMTDEEGKKLYHVGSDENGDAVYSEYGNRMIDEAIEALKGYEKPWTIPHLIEQLDTSLEDWLQSPTKNKLENESHLIFLLLASQDKRAYKIGVKYRKFPRLEVRVQAYVGLHDYYFTEQKARTYRHGSAGGLQGMMMNVDKWIEEQQNLKHEPESGSEGHY